MAGGRLAAVIGGGIGGLAAAIALRARGWEATVYERAPAVREVGAGLALWSNGLRALERLGLAERLRDLSMPDTTAGIYEPDGTLLGGTTSAELRARFGTMVVAVHRAELQGALLAELGAENVRCGAECTGLSEEKDGRVTAGFADGSSARADAVIGADGLHSVVRAYLHGARPPRYAGYTAWRAVVSFDARRLRPGETLGRGARFGRVPLTDGRCYWFATRSTPAGGRSPDGERTELLRTFGGWHEPIGELIESTPEALILRNDILDRPPLPSWGRGAITLLGDAAHPMTPNLGQGACQALEDAVVLGDALGELGRDVSTGLRAYEDRRIARANGFVRKSFRAGQVGQWANPLAVRLRALLIRRLLPRLQSRAFQEILAHGL